MFKLNRFKLDKEGDGGEGAPKANEIPAEVIAEASGLGWVPQDKFKGKPEEWVNADEFVRRGKEVLPIVKENLRRVQEDLRKAKAEIAGFGETAKEFRKFAEDAQARKLAEWEAERKALKEQLAKAVTDGEGEVAAATMELITDHDAAKPTKAAPAPKDQDVDPDFVAWRAENPWYENEELQDAAILQGMRINKKTGKTGKELYAAVKEAMAKAFPDEVDSGEGNGGMFDSGDGGPKRRSSTEGKPKPKTYESLPKEMQEGCDRMIKKGFIKDRKQYLDNVDWSAL